MSTPSDLFDGVPLNKDHLVNNYLFGLRLEDEDENPFPDSMYANAIKYAIWFVQRQIDVCILPTPVVDETHDYIVEDYRNWVYIQPDNIPIRSVERVSIEWPLGTEVLQFPDEWISFDPFRRINIIPTGGASLAAVLIGAGQILLPLLYGGARRVPDIVHIDYTAGFPQGAIPEDVLHAISLYACIQILHPAGDLIIGAGISNQEIAINALRQKIETTSSPTNAGFGARIINYKNEIKDLIRILKGYFHGPELYVA
jgi:hypothetical protein